MTVVCSPELGTASRHLVGDGPLNAPRNSPDQLLRASAVGDCAAWACIVDEHAQLVWHVARSSGLSTREAVEVSELVWRRLVQSSDAAEREGLVAWLTRVAVTECRDQRLRSPTDRGGGRQSAGQRGDSPVTHVS